MIPALRPGRLRTLVIAGFLLVSAATLIHQVSRQKERRLYWEYAGRITGRAWTPGYAEWVQHRKGDFLTMTGARVAPGQAPYTEFACEYPPGALLYFAAVRTLFDSPQSFARAHGAVMFLCIAIACACSLFAAARLRESGEPLSLWTWAFVGAWPLLTGSFATGTFDALAALGAAAGLFLAVRNRPVLAALAFGLGGAVKIWPLFALPFLVFLAASSSRRRAIECASAGAAAFILPHVLMLAWGTSAMDSMGYLKYMADRPFQIESVIGNLISFASLLGVGRAESAFGFGSHNVLGPGSVILLSLSTLVAMAGLLALIVRAEIDFRRRPADPGNTRALVAWAATAVGLIVCSSRAFSGEYLIWFLPFAIALSGGPRGAWPVAAYVAALLALRAVYGNWNSAIALEAKGTLVILVKNALVVAMVAGFARAAIQREEKSADPGASAPASG